MNSFHYFFHRTLPIKKYSFNNYKLRNFNRLTIITKIRFLALTSICMEEKGKKKKDS
jgi:hypothetical protein